MNFEKYSASVLNKLGVDEKYKGFKYIVSSISFINQCGPNVMPVTKFLYADVGAVYHTSKECVEKDIRKTIEIIWNNSDNISLISEIFGQKNTSKRPSNSNFLILLHRYISTNYNKEVICNLITNNYKFICPKSGLVCEFSNDFVKGIIYEKNL